MSRQQGFTLRTYRAETGHHLRLGASADGRLTAASHDSRELCGRKEHFAVAGSKSTIRLYTCPNLHAKIHGVSADRQTPEFMRAPPETPVRDGERDGRAGACTALDPLELRRRNDTITEPVAGRPYTSRALVECIDAGAWLERARSAAPLASS